MRRVHPPMWSPCPRVDRRPRGTAPAQTASVEGYPPAPVPAEPSGLEALRKAALGCQACDLYRSATQTVFGEGRERAWLMLVGEQPGDREDQTGAPFVGPAGELLDRALEEAGIDRRTVYVTNVVKHFKWRPRGKRRIHQKPNREEIDACRPWLDAELQRVEPEAIVCLGATAAQALIDRSFRVTRQHGVLQPSPLGPLIGATVHPSSVLRSIDSESREAAYAGLVADLRSIAASSRLRARETGYRFLMRRVEQTVEIPAPAEEVFGVASKIEELPRWQSGIISVARTDTGPVAVGAKGTLVRELMGQRIEAPLEVTAYDPPRLLGLHSEVSGVALDATIEVSPLGPDSSRVNLVAEISGSMLTSFMEPMIASGAEGDMAASLERLRGLFADR